VCECVCVYAPCALANINCPMFCIVGKSSGGTLGAGTASHGLVVLPQENLLSKRMISAQVNVYASKSVQVCVF